MPCAYFISTREINVINMFQKPPQIICSLYYYFDTIRVLCHCHCFVQKGLCPIIDVTKSMHESVWPQTPSQPLPLQTKTSMVKLAIASLFSGSATFAPAPMIKTSSATNAFTIADLPGAVAPGGFFDPLGFAGKADENTSKRYCEAEVTPRLCCHACSYWIP